MRSITTLAPVFLWAPLARCGITLLQRLISSGREIIIYGENPYFSVLCPQHFHMAVNHQPEGEQARRRLIQGDTGFWSSAAFPRMDLYLATVRENVQRMVLLYEDSSTADGRSRWGIKTPGVSAQAAPALWRQLLPRSQHIFIYRHVEDVLRSYKARKWLEQPGAAGHQAAIWNNQLLEILALNEDPQTLVVRYETLVEEPAQETERLRRFLGAAPFDLEVFDKRVNTFHGEAQNGHSPEEYVPPTPLNGEERSAMQHLAKPAIEMAGYTWES